ncbi:hypothetical protein ACNQFN_11140 [Thauera butanivorans]|uniref:hypothetical protein n=1 Tax=Thauera butanivorans TaxID=86174 RepID=UPI003AB38731
MGNTQGIIVPDTGPNPHGNSAPPIQATAKETGWWGRWGSAVTHGVLDVVGLIPVVGEIADGANALIYLAEGDTVNAALSAAAMVPGLGMAATGAKVGKRAVGAAVEGTGKAVGKETAQQASQRGAKKTQGSGGGKDRGKPRGKLKCGQHGSYGDLKKQSGDGKFDRDHIPSKAALLERAKQLNDGEKLTPAQTKAITDWGDAISIPREAHQKYSPTFGGRNNPAADAKDLAAAAKRDVEKMLDHIGEYDADGGCKKAYKQASKKITNMTNADYARELEKLLKSK